MSSISKQLIALVAASLLITGNEAHVARGHGWKPHGSSSPPLATVRNGTLKGVYQPEYHQDYFLSVPFAQPPLGDLRFRHPLPLNTSWQGEKDVTEWGADCIGYGSDDWANGGNYSEDCLTMTIVRPAGIDADSNLPVGVWIYGGGSVEGGAHDLRYNTSFIVGQAVEADIPFIAININYRVQAWGFLAGQEVAEEGSLNTAYFDQRLALHWIQENIAAFGGDPSKVTIWGESAGARSVGIQVVAYHGRDDGLFRGAIMESGGPQAAVNASSFQPTYDNITAATGCNSTADSLACLRSLTTDQLSAVFNSSVTASATWSVVYDNDLFPQSGITSMRNGQFVRVPMLQGRNHDEGTMFATKGINTDAQWEASLRSAGYNDTVIAVLSALYPDIPAIGIPPELIGRPSEPALGLQWKRASAYAGDSRQHALRRFLTQQCAKWGVPTYSYHFNVFSAGVPVYTGVTHFSEVAYVFDNEDGIGYNNSVAFDPFAGKPEVYHEMARNMSRMWASFIVDQDPNFKGATFDWPVYTNDSAVNIVMDVNVTGSFYVEQDLYRAAQIAYVERLL